MLFCEEERLGLVWELFNDRFEERFTAWMQDKGYSANTIASQYSIMKVWFAEAEDKSLITDKRFHKWVTKSHDVENIYLTEEEIERIYHLDFSSEELRSQIDPRQRIEETRDMFVVACWTGLRFGDWKDLSKIQIVGDMMTVHTRKTNKTVVIPLHPFVKEIYEKYGRKFPKVVDKTHTLSQIRQCARWAGLDEHTTLSRVQGGKSVVKSGTKADFLMNHTARRSFATNMYLKGIPPISIMAITGHTTEANFMKYIKVDKHQHAQVVARAFAS
jgi:integrase